MQWERYSALINEFDLIVQYAHEISESLIGLTPPSQQHNYASEIFLKLLAHCITLRAISPEPARRTEKKLWDLPSAAAIARCVVESFDAMAYIAARGVKEEERQFRILLWELHDANRRIKMLDALGSCGEQYLSLVGQEQNLHERVLAHGYFNKIQGNHHKSIKDRKPPDTYVSIRDQCKVNQVDYSFYSTVIMHLSHYVHTHPFAVHQLFEFRGGSAEALHLMSLPLQYSMAFLSRAISEWRALFPELAPAPSAAADRKIQLWNALVESGPRFS